MEYKVGDIIESGLVACNECKNKRISESMFHDGECLASPKERFDYDKGQKYIAGYYDCYEINKKGNCKKFEEGKPRDIDEKFSFKNFWNDCKKWWSK